ncbi:YeiH family protein [Paenibacillus arenilitoris]|uniref:YeiH family putative sulfate export transporter n=1 Tax=Paenibacillus arenilitoris TaxID=2772299 RepID=A0A927CK15_9BACL|nr:YeiH family protein [Paenibacillus arenilitoris]MBD2869518.1 YeiH family putative sulfate export transporter [Paenibacillus arenilitoris]
MERHRASLGNLNVKLNFALGTAITLLLAIAAKYIAMLPLLHIMGQLVIAILLGTAFRSWLGVPKRMTAGVTFASKKLLRIGIILLGLRLNLADMMNAGPKAFLIAAINVVFTILLVYGLARRLGAGKKLGMLTACGTAICGAAAVVAIAPQMKADDREIAISAATVALLGTVFTLGYITLYPVLGLSAAGYGIFSGATLHEIAHVIAAAAPGGEEAIELAVIVKMSRVALLVPAAILIGLWHRRSAKEPGKKSQNKLPVPWFILGFLAMSALHSLNVVPAALTERLIVAAYFLIAMAMAGLGLGVDLAVFRKLGQRAFAAGLIGSVLLAALGLLLVHAFNLA